MLGEHKRALAGCSAQHTPRHVAKSLVKEENGKALLQRRDATSSSSCHSWRVSNDMHGATQQLSSAVWELAPLEGGGKGDEGQPPAGGQQGGGGQCATRLNKQEPLLAWRFTSGF